MSGVGGRSWLRRGVAAAVATSGLLFAWAYESRSVERANRLHRTGATVEAAALYGGHLDDEADPALRYNFGTSLLELGSAAAEDELRAAREDAPREVQARSLYNTGLSVLRRAIEDAQGDSVRILAEAAVEATREALVLRPDHDDSKWNLAMAQRLLDSIDAADQRAGRDEAESALEADEVVESDNVLDVDEEQELPEDAPMEGEDETRADTSEEDFMSRLEADEILSSSHLDPTLIVRKLLALEGRSFWGRRSRRPGSPRR